MLFSAELPWCYFCAEIKVLKMTCKSTEQLFRINKKYRRKNQRQGAHTLFMRVGGAPPASWPPLDVHRPQLQLRIFAFAEKKIREKVSTCFTIQSRRQALNSLGRADLESVRGFEEGESIAVVIINHPPSPIS